MGKYEELVAAENAVFKQLAEGAEARLREIPGVFHVSAGMKEIGGRVTREMCIRIYVREKRPLESIPPRERIPKKIDGVPTDVLVPKTYQRLQDFSKHRPVKGGIAISNRVPTPEWILLPPPPKLVWGNPIGTFGCTATRRTNKKPVLLSNAHVLLAGKAEKGAYIFQPGAADVHLGDPVPVPKNKEMIATVVDSKFDVNVDCAIAELDVSSCCRCCCGIDFHDEINGLKGDDGRPPSDKIVDMRPPVSGLNVFKVGVNGRTEGIISDKHHPLHQFPGDYGFPTLDLVDQISIGSTVDFGRFSAPGDSGAAVIDEQGWIVGLLFGSDKHPDNPMNPFSYANHIEKVCDALQIDINVTNPHHTAGKPIAVPAFDVLGEMDAEGYVAARERVLAHPMAQHILADPAGAWLFALGETYRAEVVRLVTAHRPVTVAWHRAGGPALFAKGLEAFRAGRDTLPVPAHGETLDGALAKVGNALAAHGSASLRDAIATHREELLGAVRDSRTVDDVLKKLASVAIVDA
ncbi:MAG TPA: hypothetical protein VJO33_01210 [Gemmatimonadaceae bacterium]|nr:hypothetical protein [Gemmatimonadaceae bacterium]